jgi:hypothetical protein
MNKGFFFFFFFFYNKIKVKKIISFFFGSHWILNEVPKWVGKNIEGSFKFFLPLYSNIQG